MVTSPEFHADGASDSGSDPERFQGPALMPDRANRTIVDTMTETTQDFAPPPPEPPAPPGSTPAARRLVRDPDDKVVAGLCAAAGRYTSTDPVLWRVVVAALALFGGAGIALYALAWLLIPRTYRPSFVERHLRRADRSVDTVGVVLLVVVAFVLLAVLNEGAGVVVLLVIGGLAYLVFRERTSTGQSASPGAAVPPLFADPQYGPAQYGPARPPAYETPPAWEPPAPRPPRSALGPLTLSTAALVAGVLLLARELGADGINGPRVVAAALLVVGSGLLIGCWFGRARWLVAVAVALGLLLIPVVLIDDHFSGGAGERTWVPTATASLPFYRLGAGEATLDLRDLEPGAVSSIRAEIGVGNLIVLVPDDLRVRARARTGVGEVLDDPGTTSSFDRAVEVRELGPETGPVLDLDLYVGLGEIEVRRVEA